MAIDTKTIIKPPIKGSIFYIPSYQRGYRWTEHEVTALLDDINEFSSVAGNKDEYCIQPLIVKRRKDGMLEVVDGQQRLTTIYIFMQIVSKEDLSATPPFKLEYETRPNILESLSDKSFQDEGKMNDINFHYMAAAYKRINDWLDSQGDRSSARSKLNYTIRNNVVFIWYEIPENIDPISMFTKVNMGKIPLTNAELIKAMLLSRDNYSDNADKRQIEISVAWDRIEQSLQEDSFWYFLNKERPSGPRIDLLFRLLAKEYNAKLSGISVSIDENQEYFSFLVFSAILNLSREQDKEKLEIYVKALFEEESLWEKIESGCKELGEGELEKIAKTLFVEALWEKVEALCAELRGWYDDLDNYHIIGFLIASGVGLYREDGIFNLTRNKRKSAIKDALLGRAAGLVGDYVLSELTYDKRGDHVKIRRLLLLFNIATLVCESNKQNRFPFDIYKRKNWDIEHIRARAEKTDEDDEPDDSLGNLTLLDEHTNRTYKDKPFNEKRMILMERESKGLFVPVCTKNVFLKAYSANPGNMGMWTDKNDRKAAEDYIAAMVRTFNSFLGREVVRNDRNTV